MSKSVLNKAEITETYQNLKTEKGLTPQQRGLEFEKLIFSILKLEGLEPRASYRPEGEQVDGSFYWQGQTFLIEAKWVKSRLPASSIYAFKGKLDGKFHTTSGVFLAANGYSDDVEDALKFGKSLNILLFDESDIEIIFNGEVSFLEVLKFKLREAGDTGSLRASYKLKEKAEEILKSETIELINELSDDIFEEEVSKKNSIVNDLLVFVEGKSDIQAIKKFIEPIRSRYSLSYRIEALNGAENIRQLPSLLSQYTNYQNIKAVIIFLDEDQNNSSTDRLLKNIRKQIEDASIYVRTLFLFINDDLKEELMNNILNQEVIKNEQAFGRLELFLRGISEYYYDPERDIPRKALINAMKGLEWNFEDKAIEGYADYNGHSFSITTLEKLIDFLNEEMIQAMQGEMPMYWLKEQEYLDYETEVREYLHDNYFEEIEQMDWNTNEL